MKVRYVSLSLDPSLGFGVDRYSYDLLGELRRQGMEVSTLSSKDPFAFRGKAKLEQLLALPLRAAFGKADCDLFHITCPLSGGWIPLIRSMRRKPVVSTIYDLTPVIYPASEKLHFLIKGALEASAKKSDVVIAISSLTKDDIVGRFGVEPDKVKVTLLGTAPKFRPMERPPNEKFTIGYIGRFDGYKDVAFLIRAYSLFEKNAPKSSKLVLYGKGQKYAECMKLAQSLGVDAEFRGFAPEERIAAIYNSFDLFAFPSNLEGFGLPIVEAQKCGVPVLVKSGAHIPEEVTRFCLKAKDEADAAALMETVRSKGFRFTPEHRAHLEEFSIRSCAERTIEAYEQALGRR